MKNIPDKDTEKSLDIMPAYTENRQMEALWKKTFQDEYKPEVIIDFTKIKDFLIRNNEEDEYRKMRDYNYNVIHPMLLCDFFIQHPPKKWSISFLDSIPKDSIKRCLADLFLELLPFESIQKNFGTAMLFWVWHECYFYGKKREKLSEYLINCTEFVGSEKNYNLLDKSRLSQRQLHHHSFSIYDTLLLFDIIKHLPEDIGGDMLQNYLSKKLGNDFSLQPLYSSEHMTKGKEENRYRKDVDYTGKEMDIDTETRTSVYKKYIINNKERTIQIPNRDNLDIYKDRSGMTYKIFLDGPIGIGLFHHNLPIALISFSLQDKETFFIHQMQTVQSEHFDRYGRSTGSYVDPIVHTIPRQETVYDIVKLLAKKYGCKKIVIQSGEHNEWINKPRQELQYDDEEEKLIEVRLDQPHLSLDIAQKIYDVFAQKQGFKKKKKSKNREKKI